MYIIDFAKRLCRKGNISLIIYFLMNVCLISYVMYFFIPVPTVDTITDASDRLLKIYLPCLGAGVALYAISLAIALSPVGEWILRKQNKCYPIVREDHLARVMPAFREVYGKAKTADRTIPDDVELFMNEDTGMNAFAIGRKTICITKGMLTAEDDVLKAVLGHEFGHLANKDTDMILMISVGNLIVTAIFIVIRIIIAILGFFFTAVGTLFGGREGWGSAISSTLFTWLSIPLLSGVMWIWTKIGVP